ncbi:MAG: hypothetical protein JWR74_2518 [Polaromonas sp.]|jgi:hypothetical protein|nr:hypothetical protein [Polaromonas sp.]
MEPKAVGLVKMLTPGHLHNKRPGGSAPVKYGGAFVGGNRCAEPGSRRQSN